MGEAQPSFGCAASILYENYTFKSRYSSCAVSARLVRRFGANRSSLPRNRIGRQQERILRSLKRKGSLLAFIHQLRFRCYPFA